MTAEPVGLPHVAMRLAAAPVAAPRARTRVVEYALAHGAGAELAARVALAVTEAVANVVRHAYPAGDGIVTCDADLEHGLLEIVVADTGGGFRPTPGTAGLGTGLAIIADCCDDFTIAQHPEGGVEVWMRFAMAGRAA